MCPIKELTIPRHEGRHDVDATKVTLLNDDVTKNFDILLSIAMHYGKTFIPPLRAHQAENSTKYRADDLCVNLVCKYFCWMLGDPHFFFGRSLPFLTLSIILKNKKICVWDVLIIIIYTFKKGSNWYMDTGVRDLEVVFLRLILADLMTYVAKIYQIGLYKPC